MLPRKNLGASLVCISVWVVLFTDESGVRRSDIVNQYLKDIESQIETEEELAEKKILVDKVLDRLITHVSIMLL